MNRSGVMRHVLKARGILKTSPALWGIRAYRPETHQVYVIGLIFLHYGDERGFLIIKVNPPKQ
jgi:hypothetical protein